MAASPGDSTKSSQSATHPNVVLLQPPPSTTDLWQKTNAAWSYFDVIGV